VRDATRDQESAERDLTDARANASEKAADLAVKQQTYNDKIKDGLPNLLETKTQLENLIKLQPQAVAFLQPSLDVLNQLITRAAQVTPAALNLGPFGTVGIGHFQSGGFATGDFWAGEHGRELVRLRPGGGAMVYPSGQATSGAGALTISAPINIEQSFGPGTNAADVEAAMRGIAEGAITDALTTVLERHRAGSGRN
jgi:hypothetical protein